VALRVRVEADLTFSVSRTGGGHGDHGQVRGSVRADGSRVSVLVDDVAALPGTGDRRTLALLAEGLAERGLTLSVAGPAGPVATVGAVRSRLLHRLVTRSRHVRVDDWREARRVLRAQRRRGGGAAGQPGLPPSTPLPLAPTFRRLSRPVTTTHDPLGRGRPQLVLSMGPHPTRDATRKVFRLRPGTTTIGSAAGSGLRLGGLAATQALVVRDDEDEYVLVDLGAEGATTLVNGVRAERHVLRTGARIELGGWRMSYWREEHADHGRPYGGREGGELSEQRSQPRPRYRVQPPG
jgi:hypothetical protein